MEIPFALLRDPEAISNWPLTLSRDGARTPMAWEGDAPHLGFTDGQPWLPAGADHKALAVDRQEAEPDSLLQLTRRLIALRRGDAALRLGAMEELAAEGDLLRFVRRDGARRLLVACNFGDAAVALDAGGAVLAAVNGATAAQLPPLGAIILELPS